MDKNRVLVGMSGGVDSSVAADLLKQQGYTVSGCILRMGGTGDYAARDRKDAHSVADQLGIDFYVVDKHREFCTYVQDHFVASYRDGKTPNPCIQCNRNVKFRALLEKADELGIYYIATGHYARVSYSESEGRWQLFRGMDHRKDQSYVLSSLTQEQLSRLLLPVGVCEKTDIRRRAEEDQLAIADRPDSQDICFIPDGNYVRFLEEYGGLTLEPGDFVDMEGRVLGRHGGQERYTTGQRRGLGVSADRPLYVVRKEAGNRVVLGDDKDLFSTEVRAEKFNWVSLAPIARPMRVTAKTRYSQKSAEGTLYPEENGRVRVVFDQPQRAITAGQTLAVYDGDMVIGGGIICIGE